MKKLSVAVLLVASGCSGSPPSGRAPAAAVAVASQDEPGAAPVMALRLPRAGGTVRAYTLPTLAASPWTAPQAPSTARSAIAMDQIGDRLLYRDRDGSIHGFDLVAGHERDITPRGHWLTALSTDTLLAVSSDGTVIESKPWSEQPWPVGVGGGARRVFAGLGSRLLVLRDDSLAIASREAGITLAVTVPETPLVTASRNGDAVAFGTDSGLVVAAEGNGWHPWFVRLTGAPTDLAFSPSGDRIYVTVRDKSELDVVDRFARRERPAIPLPGPAAAVRMDAWGRAVLVRALGSGRRAPTWVIGVATDRVTGRIETPWRSDLPVVAEDGALLYREGNAVVARDVRTLDSLGAVPDAAGDLWFVGRWTPIMAGVMARMEALRAESASARAPIQRPRPGAAPAAAVAPAPSGPPLWVQLAESQSRGGADELVKALAREGYPAELAAPGGPGQGWRALVGPFATRAAADSVARSLARPYWITLRGPGAAAPQ